MAAPLAERLRPQTLDDVINQTVNRVLDQFDIDLPEDLFTRWQGA